MIHFQNHLMISTLSTQGLVLEVEPVVGLDCFLFLGTGFLFLGTGYGLSIVEGPIGSNIFLCKTLGLPMSLCF